MKFLLLLCVYVNIAYAHQSSLVQIVLNDRNSTITGTINIATSDIKVLLETNSTIDNSFVKIEEENIQNVVSENLFFSRNKMSCNINYTTKAFIFKQKSDDYIQLPFEVLCDNYSNDLVIKYTLLFNDDFTHKALLRFTKNHNEQLMVFYNFKSVYHLQTNSKDKLTVLKELFSIGMHHIFGGYDHLLFLCALLLSIVLVYENGRYKKQYSIKKVLIACAKIVTTFTVAHSITLGLVFYKIFTINSMFVESFISFSIALAALHTLKPIFKDKHLYFIFAIGLIHGMGFATYLSELGLQSDIKFYALVAFNLGVEFGQLVFVASVLPLLLFISKYKIYHEKLIYLFSILISIIGIYWMVQVLSI